MNIQNKIILGLVGTGMVVATVSGLANASSKPYLYIITDSSGIEWCKFPFVGETTDETIRAVKSKGGFVVCKDYNLSNSDTATREKYNLVHPGGNANLDGREVCMNDSGNEIPCTLTVMPSTNVISGSDFGAIAKAIKQYHSDSALYPPALDDPKFVALIPTISVETIKKVKYLVSDARQNFSLSGNDGTGGKFTVSSSTALQPKPAANSTQQELLSKKVDKSFDKSINGWKKQKFSDEKILKKLQEIQKKAIKDQSVLQRNKKASKAQMALIATRIERIGRYIALYEPKAESPGGTFQNDTGTGSSNDSQGSTGAVSRYPGCDMDDIPLGNGQVWSACDAENGKTYRWNIVSDSPQGPCKNGYHVPSRVEFKNAVDDIIEHDSALRSNFKAQSIIYWTSTKKDDNYAYMFSTQNYEYWFAKYDYWLKVNENQFSGVGYPYAIRCMKDPL